MINKMENKNDVTMEKNYTVYKHVCPNGKVYIGITRQIPEMRWRNGYGYKPNKYFWSAIQKYEWNNFEHEIIENNLTKEQAENMEIELIAKYRSNDREYGYNIESGGNCKGKASDETRKKISESNKGKKHSIETRKKLSDVSKGKNNANAKKVHCNGIIFDTLKDCANYYSIIYGTMNNWMTGKNPMNTDFQKLNLRYATNDDLNKYEKYDTNKHGDKANINFNINNGKFIHCDNLIFKSSIECANYYGINKNTMRDWLKGRSKTPLNFQKLNLRYATNEDLNTYPRYTLTNN